MTIIRVLILVLICQCGCTQDYFSNSISLKINEDSLRCVEPCNTTTITMTISNSSDEDILVYGLMKGGPGPAFYDLSGLCDVKRTGTGMQFVLYRADGTQKMARFEISDRIGQRPVGKRMLDSTLHQMKVDFLKSAIILKKHEERTFIKQVPLHNFNLQNGLYYLQLCYYCGEKTAETLDLSEVRRSGAKLFQGCANSERVPLVFN